MATTTANAVQKGGGTAVDTYNVKVAGSIETTTGGVTFRTSSLTAEAGTVRWNGTDFQGYTGASWESFTSTSGGGAGGWIGSSGIVRLLTVSDNVGIGTDVATSKLQVKDGAFLDAGTAGATPTSGSGTRLMWVPVKSAFRAGSVTGTNWDDANLGVASYGFGYDVKPGGDSNRFTLAMGCSCAATSAMDWQTDIAFGRNSIANAFNDAQLSIVFGNKTNQVNGQMDAVIFGTETNVLPSATMPMTFGYRTYAGGVSSLATGYKTGVNATYATSFGYTTAATGQASVVMGENVAFTKTYSLGVGYSATSSGSPDVLLNPNGDSYLSLDTGGVAIGATDPQGYKLYVNGNTYINGSLEVNSSNAAKTGGGTWNTLSDGRLKDITGDYTRGGAELAALQPVTYRYKKNNPLEAESVAEHTGFIAQDVEKTIPEAVTVGGKGYLSLNADPVYWAMLNSIKERQARIEKRGQLLAMIQSEVERLKEEMIRNER